MALNIHLSLTLDFGLGYVFFPSFPQFGFCFILMKTSPSKKQLNQSYIAQGFPLHGDQL